MNLLGAIAGGILGILRANEMITTAVITVLMLLVCFLGVKIFRIYVTIVCALSGLFLGCWIPAAVFSQSTEISLTIGAIAAVLFAAAAARIHLVGVMLGTWLFGTVAMLSYIRPMSILWLLLCMGIGLVLTLISIRFETPMLILVTSVAGGIGAVSMIVPLIGLRGNLIVYAGGVVLALIGIAIQLVLEGRKQGRQAVATAKVIQSEESVENEIEAARAMISKDDE